MNVKSITGVTCSVNSQVLAAGWASSGAGSTNGYGGCGS